MWQELFQPLLLQQEDVQVVLSSSSETVTAQHCWPRGKSGISVHPCILNHCTICKKIHFLMPYVFSQ